ncbi:MAG: helix-turn-helix domain-containing protein [Dehalococcoidia bacterium]
MLVNSQQGQFAILRRLWYKPLMSIDAGQYKTPGQLIAAALEEKGWTQRVLAIVLDVHETSINKLIAGKRPITAPLAVELEELFGIPAEDFLELQKVSDVAQARFASRPDPGRSTRAHLFGGLPVSEMIQRGWLNASDIRDVPSVEAALTDFFGEASLEAIEILPHAPKKTNVSPEVTPAQLAWLYRVRQIAAEMIVGRYSPTTGRGAIAKLSNLLLSPEEARKAPRILAESGIRFVVVESLSTAKIDGACLWLDEASPVIGMSLRYDRIDNFWFVLRHELEHVLAGHGQGAATLDAELEGERAGTSMELGEQERAANAAAADFCVPEDQLKRFIARKAPFFAERDILGFARTLRVHPGIVAGQLQHETGRYERFRSHLVKIRDMVRPSAIVDGWGDIVPVGI